MNNNSNIIKISNETLSDPIKLLFAGDFCPRNHTEPLILAGKSNEIISDIKHELDDKDLSIINLETPLTLLDTPIHKTGPNLKVHPDCVNFLKEANFDIACCANNHIGDYGTDAVDETISHVNKNGIKTVGAGSNLKNAAKPLFIDKNNKKIAILAFAENEFGVATESEGGSNPLDPLNNINDIKVVSEQADITIVLIHGGNEFNPVPSPRMKKTYRAFIDAGATAVIGGHTHCSQGFEIYKGSPIVYSLSNLLFDVGSPEEQYEKPLWWNGYMVRLVLNGTTPFRLEIIPHTCAPHAEKVLLLKDKEKEEFLSYYNHISKIIIDKEAADKYWNAWCVMAKEGYLKHLLEKEDIDINNPDDLLKLLVMRNLHTCESHNELITNFLYLAVKGKLEDAAKYIEKLKLLQKGKF